MLAEVAPLRNLPRKKSIFTYKIPLLRERDFIIGQIVEIPFQKKIILGVILRIVDEITGETTKEIIKTVNSRPFFSIRHLRTLEEISMMYGAPLPTLAKMALPKIRKTKFSKAVLEECDFAAKKTSAKKNRYYLYKNQSEHFTGLNDNRENYTLILAPKISGIKEIFLLLSKENQDNSVIWHSELKDKEQFSAWLKIRNGEKKIIISARSGVFLPFFKLDSIIVDYEHDENHKHWDQKPRFNAKDIARILASRYQADYAEMSYSPSVEAYYNVYRKGWKANNFDFTAKDKKLDIYGAVPPFISQSPPDKQNFIPQAVQDRIIRITNSNSNDKDIFILLNRKGFAGALKCRKCGHSEQCGICEMPLAYLEKENALKCPYCKTLNKITGSCAKCGSLMINLVGPGIESLVREVKKIVKNPDYDIVTIDGESKKEINSNHAIVIGTSAAFSCIRWNKTSFIAYLGIDREINLPEYNTLEKVWHKIQEIQFRKNKQAELALCANSGAQGLFKSLSEPDRFYRTDLNSRQKAVYPPYSYIAKLFYGNFSQKISQKEAERVAQIIKGELTKTGKKHIIIGPIEMHPFFYRKNYWHALIIKLMPDYCEDEIKKIVDVIPDSWKIDLNPISLLSP